MSSLGKVLEPANATTRAHWGDANVEATDYGCARRCNSGRVNYVFYLIENKQDGEESITWEVNQMVRDEKIIGS